MKKFLLFLGLAVLLVGGCNTSQSYQSIEEKNQVLFSKPMAASIRYQGINRNPVIFIHGLLGAKLVCPADNENIWGTFSAAKIADPKCQQKLARPMLLGVPLSKLPCNAQVSGLLEKSEIRLSASRIFSFELNNYDLVIDNLNKIGYFAEDSIEVSENGFPPSLFKFAYDWRDDISVNAAKLNDFLHEKRKMLQKVYEEKYNIKDYDVKFDLIGHSMGGLVCRYYMQYGSNQLPDDYTKLPELSEEGAEHVEKVVIVGTPNAGYPDTVLELIQGLQLAPGAPFYPPQLIGTFSSYYFMMPHNAGKHVTYEDGDPIDIYDIENWKRLNWGLADYQADAALQNLLPNAKTPAERRKIALDALDKNLKKAKQFTDAMEVKMQKRPNVLIYLFGGDATETNRTLIIDSATGKVIRTIKEAGDGKIPATSTRFDLRDWDSKKCFLDSPIPWDGIFYLGVGHMGFFRSNAFFTNLSSVLCYYATPRQEKLENRKNNPSPSSGH